MNTASWAVLLHTFRHMQHLLSSYLLDDLKMEKISHLLFKFNLTHSHLSQLIKNTVDHKRKLAPLSDKTEKPKVSEYITSLVNSSEKLFTSTFIFISVQKLHQVCQ